jgi:hypothetical protein
MDLSRLDAFANYSLPSLPEQTHVRHTPGEPHTSPILQFGVLMDEDPTSGPPKQSPAAGFRMTSQFLYNAIISGRVLLLAS